MREEMQNSIRTDAQNNVPNAIQNDTQKYEYTALQADFFLEAQRLRTHFLAEHGYVTAVRDLDFKMRNGTVHALVGESGCGKSVLAKSIARLFDEKRTTKYAGRILLDGVDILNMPYRQFQAIRKNTMAMVFQDPLTSLNPLFPVGRQLVKTLMRTHKMRKAEAQSRAEELWAKVGLKDPRNRMRSYPHELSGGMKQRVMIAMVLSKSPRLLIADEPTTALDVSVEAQIMELFQQLKVEHATSILFVTHDLALVESFADEVSVMYSGEIVESARAEVIFANPRHPYTYGLIHSRPTRDSVKKSRLYSIPGRVDSVAVVRKGCAFCERCEYADNVCKNSNPSLVNVGDEHFVRCHKPLPRADVLPATGE